MPLDPKVQKEFEKWKKTPPSVAEHGTEAEIKEKMTKLMPNSWRLEGNKLIGDTDVGPLVQLIPTDYILKGTDKKGLPIFEKIKT